MMLNFNSTLILGPESSFNLTYASGVLSGALCIVILLWLRMLKSPPKILPPGPKSWPVVGCIPTLLYLAYVKKMDKVTLIKHLVDTYGNVISINVLGRITIILSGYDTIKEAYKNPALCARPKMELGIASWRRFDSARRHRRIIMGALKGKFGFQTERIEEVVYKQLGPLLATIKSFNGRASNLYVAVRAATGNALFSLLTGKNYDCNDEKTQEVMAAVHEEVYIRTCSAARIFLPKLIFSFLSSSEKHKCSEIIWSHVSNMVAAHTATNNDPSNMIDVYRQEMPRSSDLQFNDDFMRDGLVNLIRAGTDTVAILSARFILHLTLVPDIQERVYQEIIQVVGKERLPCWSDRHQLHYTQTTIYELQRHVHPLATIPHAAEKETILNGFTIPEEACVISLSTPFYDETLSPKPEAFKPERFLDDRGHFQERAEYFPFGTGRRSCPGESLGRMELFLFIVIILQRFTIRLPDGVDVPLDRLKDLDNFLNLSYNAVLAIPRDD